MSNNLPIKVGGYYYVACHSQGFGNYFIVVQIKKITHNKPKYGNYVEYSIFVHKYHDPYHDAERMHPGEHWKREVYLRETQRHMKHRFIPLSQEDINAIQEASVRG